MSIPMSEQHVGMRLAFRVEGLRYVAYFADLDSMDGAEEIASMASACLGDDEIRGAFMALSRSIFSAICQEVYGFTPEWKDDPVPAPQHERAGHA